ncbi:unnamed protein product [Allacma fusca]|uniref:Uncharacterized protein n=1 Tax=Allacma fusca TaxID=39272 RepID=A0A8J2PIT4_9HEXA|nr:unnamed protein product [Allacma fusca]
MVGSQESIAPGVFTHPPVLQSCSLYTYSSPPQPLHGNQGRTRKYRNKVPRPRGIHDYYNIMWDPHIRRGNTGTRVAQPDELEPKSSNETSGKGVRKKRSYNLQKSRYRVQTHRTPPPIQGRLHNLVQTDTYLEDLGFDLSITEADVNIQTDLMQDESVSPAPIPMKTGVDASTQVLPGELSDFDDDVQPIVATLVAKILEQSLMETMEEEELIALKEQQNRFEEKKQQEEKQLKLLQEQHERITAERERLKRHLESQNIHTCAQDQTSFRPSSSGGPVYSTEYLLELLPSVLDSLRQEGFLSDNISDSLVPNISSRPDNGVIQEEPNSDPEAPYTILKSKNLQLHENTERNAIIWISSLGPNMNSPFAHSYRQKKL